MNEPLTEEELERLRAEMDRRAEEFRARALAAKTGGRDAATYHPEAVMPDFDDSSGME